MCNYYLLWAFQQGPRPLVLLLYIQTHYLISDIKMMCYTL